MTDTEKLFAGVILTTILQDYELYSPVDEAMEKQVVITDYLFKEKRWVDRLFACLHNKLGYFFYSIYKEEDNPYNKTKFMYFLKGNKEFFNFYLKQYYFEVKKARGELA